MPLQEDVVKSVVWVLILGFHASGCDNPDEPRSTAVETTAEQDVDFVQMATAGKMLSDLQTYLASDAPPLQTFTFDRLTFIPGSSAVRPVDQRTIYALANILKNRPNTRIRIIGYGDGLRQGASDQSLPLKRAASIAGALRTAGVDASRLETAAGREAGKGRAAQLLVLQK